MHSNLTRAALVLAALTPLVAGSAATAQAATTTPSSDARVASTPRDGDGPYVTYPQGIKIGTDKAGGVVAAPAGVRYGKPGDGKGYPYVYKAVWQLGKGATLTDPWGPKSNINQIESSLGAITKVKGTCEGVASFQEDNYLINSPKAETILKDVLADHVLTHNGTSGEDRGLNNVGWGLYTVKAPESACIKPYTATVQVDRYYNPTSALAKSFNGYWVAKKGQAAGALTYREDRPHWGHSAWQIVTAKSTVDVRTGKVDKAALIKSINAQTSGKVGDVSLTTLPSVPGAGKDMTVASVLGKGATAKNPWGVNHDVPQTAVAHSR